MKSKMVILITGASHTGKTVLAQRMLEKYNYPYLSVDHLKMGLIRSGNTDLTPMDDDKLTDYLWPIVDDIIKHGSDVEQRLEADSNCTPEWIKAGKRLFIERFGKAGEKIILIDDDYNAVNQKKKKNARKTEGETSYTQSVVLE